MDSKNNVKSDEKSQKEKNELENVRALLAFKGQYHHHKETMAHAALIVQLGVLAWLLQMERTSGSFCLTKVLIPLGYVLIWDVITCYIVWELYNRIVASKQVNKLIEALEDKTQDPKMKEIIAGMKGKCGGTILGTCIVVVADVLILIIGLVKVLCL